MFLRITPYHDAGRIAVFSGTVPGRRPLRLSAGPTNTLRTTSDIPGKVTAGPALIGKKLPRNPTARYHSYYTPRRAQRHAEVFTARWFRKEFSQLCYRLTMFILFFPPCRLSSAGLSYLRTPYYVDPGNVRKRCRDRIFFFCIIIIAPRRYYYDDSDTRPTAYRDKHRTMFITSAGTCT